MSYLLDTNACIAIINGKPAAVRERLRQATGRGEGLTASAITLLELWYGVGKSMRTEANTERLAIFMARIEALPFDDEDARAAGIIRAELEQAGTPIGAYDVLIAGQAVRRNMTLVTANVSEFARVARLQWENWAV